MQELEAERQRLELLRQQAELENALKEAAALNEAERERELERLRKQQEALLEEKRRAALRALGPCPAGFAWRKEGSMWYCGGGSHSCSDAQIDQYMRQLG